MDFLEIRKKARERAATRAAAEPLPAGPASAPTPAPAAATLAPGAARSATDDRAADALRDAPAPDERFTTWRPGSGGPPRIEQPDAFASPAAASPAIEELTVLSALSGALQPPEGSRRRAVPARAPAEGRSGAAAADPLDDFFYCEDEEAPEIAIGGAADRAAATEAPAAVDEFLTFLLGGEEYAVAIERVREVLKAPPITEVPRAPGHILGVVAVRGEIVAVCDPRRRLGLGGEAPRTGAARIVIVDAGEGPCGLLVDGVASVVRLRRGTLEPRPQGIGGAHAESLAGIGRDGERLFTVLDLPTLLRRVAAPVRRDAEGDRHAP